MEFGCVAPAGETAKFDEILGLATGTLGNEALSESILLATHEMLANIREHQYRSDLTPPIAMSIFITRREVIITMIDVGDTWCENGYLHGNDSAYKLRVLAEEGAQRGRGQLLMGLLADSVRYLHGGRVRQLAWRR